jgi:hypothetical protein
MLLLLAHDRLFLAPSLFSQGIRRIPLLLFYMLFLFLDTSSA